MNKLSQITDLLSNLKISENKIIIIHARIKTIKDNYDLADESYGEITKTIIDYLTKKFNPETIIIPAYTFSYTKTGVYHKLFSKSEVGRFSEEARKIGYYRTPDPIFSFIDTKSYFEDHKVNHKIAFGKGSIFEYFHNKDAVVLNIGLDKFIATQRHYAEYWYNVEYRFNKYFRGTVYNDETNFEDINYEYYVRHLDRPTDGNLPKITKELISDNVLQVYKSNNVNLFWLTCQSYMDFFKSKMKSDINYMIK
jgi:aminoglycoside 3-N-acetyltransferase